MHRRKRPLGLFKYDVRTEREGVKNTKFEGVQYIKFGQMGVKQ